MLASTATPMAMTEHVLARRRTRGRPLRSLDWLLFFALCQLFLVFPLEAADADEAASSPPAEAPRPTSDVPQASSERPGFKNRLSLGLSGLGVFTDDGDIGSLDLSLSERLRWEFLRRSGTRIQLDIDGRLALDLAGRPMLNTGWTPLELTRLTRLGFTLTRPKFSILLGRYPVRSGGFRLVDGLQVLVNPKPEWTVGVWGGLVPDIWTTLPAVYYEGGPFLPSLAPLRFGGGPIISYERRWLQLSLAGEFVGTPEGLDRVAGLLRWRVAALPGFQTGGRIDLQLLEPGEVGPLDAAAYVVGRPHRNLRLRARYGAYSSVRYLTSDPADPLVRRFAARALTLELRKPPAWTEVDSSLHHDVNLNVRWQKHPNEERTMPRLEADVRFRYHPLEEKRFGRISAKATLTPIAQRLDVAVDTTVLFLTTGPRVELGAIAWLNLGARRNVGLDGSVRVGFTGPPDKPTVDLYTDLFVQALASKSWSFAAGVFFETYSAERGWETALGGLGRVTWKLRAAGRKTHRQGKSKRRRLRQRTRSSDYVGPADEGSSTLKP